MVKVGDTLYGFCNGFFGDLDTYGQKVIEAIGKDWIVARLYDGTIHFARFMGTRHQMEELLNEWSEVE